ncbi:MAG: hypothetical protein QG656_789, partial [Candidatus Hydrogenedentes bacterium]|nr:hypothetical protein [Candidatus Hydrogenedentota bacterium]
PFPPHEQDAYAVPANQVQIFGRPLDAWVDDLNGIDALTRLRAIKTIGLCPEAAPALLAALHDYDTAVTYWAAVGLGTLNIRTPEAVEALKQAALNRPMTTRLGAARALAALGEDEAALPVALEALQDKNEFTRLFAAQILEDIGADNPQVREALEKALDDKSKYIVRVAEHALSAAAGR